MMKQQISKAASMMGRRSAAARRKNWGERDFVKKMRTWGKLGGRPKKEVRQGLTKGKSNKGGKK